MPASTNSPNFDDYGIKPRVFSVIDSIEKRLNQPSSAGLLTGFTDLDRLTNGFQGGELIVFAARPSMGKTSLVMSMVEFMSIGKPDAAPGAIFSPGVSAERLVERMICSRAEITGYKVRANFLDKRDLARLVKAASEIGEAPLWIDDSWTLTIDDLQTKAEYFKERHNIQYIAIDNLQRIQAGSISGRGYRELGIGAICRGLKTIARKLDIPIIVLSQLSRRTDSHRGGPRLSDLRDSEAIEEEADLVGLLTRPEYYAEDPEEREEMAGYADLIIAKNRNGPTGDVRLKFYKEFMKFGNRVSIE